MTIKEQTKALWKRCFNDSNDFTDLYFRLRYSEEVNQTLKEGNEVIAALQMLPYPMTFCGRTVPTSYISGACTHPDHRNRGAMRTLLAHSFERMRQKGILFSTLIPAEPWLFNYYGRLGYATVFSYATEEVTPLRTDGLSRSPVDKSAADCKATAAQTSEISVRPVEEYDKNIYDYLNRHLAGRPCCIQHTPDDFHVVLADLKLGSGRLLVASKGASVQGMVFLYRQEAEMVISEWLADDDCTEQRLREAVFQLNEGKRILRLLPPSEGHPSHPLGMARLINVPAVLQLYAAAFPQEEHRWAVTDELLPLNNGYYLLAEGTCTYGKTPLSEPYEHIGISELTQRLLTPLRPYMSLMLNK